jgi:hypothetical protein
MIKLHERLSEFSYGYGVLRANPTGSTCPSRSRWTWKSATPRACGGRREVDSLWQGRTRQHLAGWIVADVGEVSETFQHAEPGERQRRSRY